MLITPVCVYLTQHQMYWIWIISSKFNNIQIWTCDTVVAPEWHFCQTIVQYDVTIVAPWRWTICYNIVLSILYFESICTITEGHVTRNWPIRLDYLHLTYNNDLYYPTGWHLCQQQLFCFSQCLHKPYFKLCTLSIVSTNKCWRQIV